MRLVYEQKKKSHHLAILKKGSKKFEVLLIPDKAIAYKKGKIDNVREALEAEDIFSDAKKGERAPNLKEVFGTDNVLTIASEIIKKGYIQLTSEYRKKLQEQKKKEVINIISTHGIDPRNKLPIPLTRIELAFEQIKYNFDPFKSAEEQVDDVINLLRPILPIRFEEKTVEGFIGSKYGSKAHGIIKKYGKIIKSEWMSDGSWHFVIKIPGGLQNEFMKILNNITHGQVNIK